MKRYMLDTNVVSNFMRGNAKVDANMIRRPAESLFVSSIVAAELLYGVFRKPEAVRLNALIREFLSKSQILPWDSSTAQIWADFRTRLEKAGKMLTPHDMQIAAHAISLDMILVTDDRAFLGIDGLEVENWA
jgi:tRNA(fMet)-specific endonuclease VapC